MKRHGVQIGGREPHDWKNAGFVWNIILFGQLNTVVASIHHNFAAEMNHGVEMKRLRSTYCMMVIVLSVLAGCRNDGYGIPVGDWISRQGRPMIRIAEKGGGFSAIVFHRTYSGDVCPVEYPLVTGSSGMYIQAEGRIIVSYSEKRDELFLSPGGVYIRKGQSVPGSLKSFQ